MHQQALDDAFAHEGHHVVYPTLLQGDAQERSSER